MIFRSPFRTVVLPALGIALILVGVAIAVVLALRYQEIQSIRATADIARVQLRAYLDHTANIDARIAPTLQALQRPGVHVEIIDMRTGKRYGMSDGKLGSGQLAMGGMMHPPGAPGPPNGAGPPPGARRQLQSVWGAIGIRPIIVPLSPVLILVVRPEQNALLMFAIIIGFSLIVALVASVLILHAAARSGMRAALEPIVSTTVALRALAAGDFTERHVAESDSGVMGDLVDAYNAATRRVAIAMEEEASARASMRRFIGDAGHELRTPLTILSGYLDVLARSPSDADMHAKVLPGMSGEIKRMRRLVENLLALTRIEGRAHDATPIDLSDIAKTVVERLSRMAGDREVHLRADAPIKVRANASDIETALGNLIENALKYGASSDVVVHVASEGNCAKMTVSDSGPGITRDESELLFERFYRGVSAPGIEGSGLGLSIARRAVERNGGTLHAAPSDRGASFVIELPCETAAS